MRFDYRKLSDEEFKTMCRENPYVQFELNKDGEMIISPLKNGTESSRNFLINGEFGKWSEKDRSGIGFASSTLFNLPNGAKRSPDLAWIKNERWESLTNDEQEKFPPLCPDFVIELRSRTDAAADLQSKMEEYLENGAKLGWLIDPYQQKVYIYRQNEDVEILDNPKKVSGEPLLKNFILKMEKIWS